MSVIDPKLLKTVAGFEQVGEFAKVFYGDFTGDGGEDIVLRMEEGGGNNTNYHYYYQLLLLTPDKVKRFQDIIAKSTSEEKGDTAYFEFEAEIKGSDFNLWDGTAALVRDHPVDERASEAATDAYAMIDSMIVRRFEGRVYADVLGPHEDKTTRVLLSFDKDMRPRAECIVDVKANDTDYRLGGMYLNPL